MSAFAALAAHPVARGLFVKNTEATAPSSTPFKSDDEHLPSCCFSFGHVGLSEGIVLLANNPQFRAPVLMFQNGTWMMRSPKDVGARFRKNDDGTAVMYRAAAELFEPSEEKKAEGKRPYYALSRPVEEVPDFNLVHVHSGLRPGVKPKLPLTCGIEGSLIVAGAFGTEGLYYLSEGSPIRILRADGTVITLQFNQSGWPTALLSDLDESTECRIEYMSDWLERSMQMSGEEKRARSVDRACYELVNMVETLNRYGEKGLSSQMQVVDLLLKLRKEGTLRFAVHRKLSDVLQSSVESVRWHYEGSIDSDQSSDMPVSEEQKKLRQERLKLQASKKQARIDRDKADANERRSRKRPSQGEAGTGSFRKREAKK